jgi:NAD(P)-dependent dehydrogenase (short-subunit alcohol dehydrogenase family)
MMWGAPLQGYMEWQAKENNVSVESLKAQVEETIALGRLPTDDECARAALFMASNHASAITGAALDVNGGAWMP